MTSFFDNTDRDSWLDAIDTEELATAAAFLSEIAAPTVLEPLARCTVPTCTRLVWDDEWDTANPLCEPHAKHRDDRIYKAAMRSYDYTLRDMGIEPHPDVHGEDEKRPRARGARA